ncbi:InlB B-repeat-containing protein [Proteiniclasticum sp. QWL-01]|uniref:InlB B-repeat-containing protein n=1 Tax=Proteiniclasticum sp. QWL-01 TaxID=3036945 RepID=UPI002410E48C|nr:InlB B-repeat-containing protein [Proteiniclasticum sp. QWL-01]WFF73249.1 InlB B-repeat-containing protein [Proteiniclasticum sp. QWL-01]
MNFKKSVFRCFVSVMLLFFLIFGLTVPAFATGLAPEKSTQYIQYNSATKELIEKTISELSAKGKVYKPKTDKALGLKVKQISGLSLGAVKTSILFDLFSNYEDGRIDTARFGLDAVTIEKVLNMTLKEFALDSAVDIVEIKTDDNGIAIGIEFEMRSSFKSGLDEFSSVSKGEPGAVDDTAPTVDNTVRDGKGGTETAAVTVTETEVNAASGWTAEFNWSYRYVGDPTNQVGLVFRGGEIQAASTDENGYFLTKIEFYLESITLTPLQPDGNPVPDTEPVILPASEGTVSTVGNKTTITYPNGLKVEDLFVDNAYLGGLQAELNTELENNGGVPNEKALQLIDQLNALGPCIFSHVLTASFTDPANYPSYDETLADVYKETINATELAVYQYYAELCDFNGAFPQHFGSAANFWTSKDTSSGGTPILGALKTLCNMQPDTFVPFGAYDADQNGELDMQTEIGLDFLISMLTQAFMAYEQQLGPLLDAKIYDCAQQINENMTTEQKMLAIHDWLANNAEFDIGIITAMKDGTSGGSDPSQMTAFGTLLYEPLGIEGAICLGYAATYYLLLQQVMGLKTDVNDIVMVRWWADIAETSVAGPDSGFGQGRFNETHYFNAVKLGEEWYYIDACYDDIYCEVMTQYRVETDGNISHNYFLFAPTSALNMFDGNVDYVDSAYDGVTFQRRLDLDDQGQVQYKNMSPVYETDTDEAGNEHVIWYHSDYPEAAQDADDATNAYLDSSIECSETAYDDTQYEKSWFTAAMGEIHCDGTYYYYVAGELNSYTAMSGNDFDNGQGGDYDIDVNLGEIFNNDDPSFADRLVRRKMTAPVNATQDSANESNWARQVEIEFSMNGGEPMTAERDVFVDPYTETIFHYGFGTLGQPRLDSDKTTPILGEDGNYINDKTEVPLLAEYADIVAYDAEFMEIYPDLAHTSGVYDGKLYFNVANQIYSLSIADIADWDYTIALLKEYNTVSYFSDGLDFGNENGSRFTGKTFHLTSDQAKAIGTMTGKPIAAISLEDRWEVTGEGIIHHPTLTVSIGTNLSESTKDSNEKSYRVEAVNYNPNYITGYSDEDENSNVEFMWCANLVEDLLMSNIEADLAAGADSAVEVTVAPFCLTDGFTERRGSITGVSIPETRVVDEGTALGHDYAWNDAQSQYICNRCGAVSGETSAQQTIIYDSNTGSGTMADTTGDTGASVMLRENTFTKAGYTFTGWNTAADGSGTSYADKASITMPAGGLTLYAQWDADQQTITYDSNTGSGTMADTTGDTGASVTLRENTFTKAGYTFTGWNTAADGSGTGYVDKASITMPAGGLTLYAQWDADQQTITYDSNTGSGTMADTTGDTGASVTLRENTFTKAGYTFTGWNTAADGSGTSYADKASITMPAGGLTLYAQWDAAQQTITYDSNTGSGTMADTTGDTDSSVTLSENTFIKADYTFTGWNTAADGSGTGYADKASITMPAGGLTLYAQWTAAQQTITYDSNTGSGTMADTTGDTGASVMLRENTFTKAGYTFTGWNTAADGSGTGYADKASITMPAGGLTLYAQWTAAQQTITYDSNTGSGTMADTTGDTGASVTLRENTFTKAGYTFTGWNTAADGSGTGYADKASITMPTGGLTLYAQWTAAQQTITYEVIAGANRYDTAALISKQLNDSADTVILTTGKDFPDALSAGPLAVQVNAPILLCEVNKIPTETMTEINRLGASKVIILGGLKVIASSVETTLQNKGISVERISGDNRFLTAIETAKKVRASSGQLKKAILVNGYDFADALSIGSDAAKAGIPILLTSPKSLSPETKQALVEFGIKEIEIIGGEQAVSKAVEDELAVMGISVSRISGSNRFATSAAVAGQYFADSQNAIISTGRGFADALAAVPLAVKQDAPILLVEKNSLPTEISSYLGGSIINNISIVGGELAVSSAVRNQILDILQK